MSITNIKDLDVLICKYLDDKDLVNFSQVNKYYNKIFNNKYLWTRKILNFDIKKEYLCKELNKQYYIELYRALKNEDFVKLLYYSIIDKRCDIVSLVFKKRSLNPNFYFVFKNFRGIRVNNCYHAKKHDNNVPFEYSPINLCIKHGFYIIWDFFNSTYKLELNSQIYIVTISSNDLNILKDVLKYNIFIEHWVLLFSIRHNNVDATKMILEKIEESQIYDMFNFIIIDFKDEYTSWIKNFNSSFLEVLKVVDIDYLKRVGRNNKNFINLVNAYISSMETYSK